MSIVVLYMWGTGKGCGCGCWEMGRTFSRLISASSGSSSASDAFAFDLPFALGFVVVVERFVTFYQCHIGRQPKPRFRLRTR